MPRLTKRTPDVVSTIIDGLSSGIPLAELCRREGMPSPSTWRSWCDDDETLAIAYARARDEGFDAIASDGLRIVDNVEEDPASRRVRADYRLKLLAKWDPRRYGDKVDVTTGGEKLPPSSVTVRFVRPDGDA